MFFGQNGLAQSVDARHPAGESGATIFEDKGAVALSWITMLLWAATGAALVSIATVEIAPLEEFSGVLLSPSRTLEPIPVIQREGMFKASLQASPRAIASITRGDYLRLRYAPTKGGVCAQGRGRVTKVTPSNARPKVTTFTVEVDVLDHRLHCHGGMVRSEAGMRVFAIPEHNSTILEWLLQPFRSTRRQISG